MTERDRNDHEHCLRFDDLRSKLDEDRKILNGLDLDDRCRRSTCHHGAERLRQVDALLCAGRAATGYEVTRGAVTFSGEDLLAMEPDERAAKGLFLAFQYPIEIPGVATMQFLKVALNASARRAARRSSRRPTS